MAKKARQLMTRPATRNARRAPRIKFGDTGPALRGTQLSTMEFLLCDRLPEDYRSFLRRHNGGIPVPSYFIWRAPTEEKRCSRVDRLFGLDPRPLHDPHRSGDCIWVTLKYGGLLPRWSVPIGFVDDENVLLIYVGGPREGQIWLMLSSAFPMHIDEPWNPDTAADFVAKSFRSFLQLLRDDAEAAVNA